MINYRTLKPQAVLAEYVRYFWMWEAHVKSIPEPFVHRALPSDCIELIFLLQRNLSISASGREEVDTFASGVLTVPKIQTVQDEA